MTFFVCLFVLAQGVLQAKVSKENSGLPPKPGATGGSEMVPPSPCFSLALPPPLHQQGCTKLLLHVLCYRWKRVCRTKELESESNEEESCRRHPGAPSPWALCVMSPFAFVWGPDGEFRFVSYIMLQLHSPVFSRKLWSSVY